MLQPAKMRSQDYYRRQIDRYEQKLIKAKNPTQKTYAFQMKKLAENGLAASLNGKIVTDSDTDLVDLDRSDYKEIS